MGRISVSQEIDAAPAAVWRAIEPIERHVDWMRDARAIHFESELHRGAGTRFVCDTVIGPIEYDAKGDIKQIDYVVYRWDAKGGYAEISGKGS